MPLQRSAQLGVLTDLAYVQLEGRGVMSVDLGFPIRYSHSPCEVVDLTDLERLTELVQRMLDRIDRDFDRSR